MAKRTNQSPRKRKDDDYDDDRTIIKIAPPKKDNKSTSARGTRTSTSRSSQSSTSKPTSSNQSKSKPAPKKQNTPRKEPRKTSAKSTPRKTPRKTLKKTDSKPSEINTPSQKNTPAPPVQKVVTPPSVNTPETIKISQSVAILIDGNNIEMSLTKLTNNKSAVLNFDKVIPKLLNGRGLNRLIYFREGRSISKKLADRLHTHYFGSVVPCHKSADIPLSIQATQLAEKVDTIIILSGDSDYVELVRHVKSKGVRVEIAAIEITTAAILIEEADYYRPITEEDAFIVK